VTCLSHRGEKTGGVPLPDGVQEISPQALLEKLKENSSLTVIDVREDEEVATGRIEQAVPIRLADLPRCYSQLEQTATYVMVCRAGHRSAVAAQFLIERGYHALSMAGGMLEWTGKTV
jgi:Rhodanese-related sulfurtransferase